MRRVKAALLCFAAAILSTGFIQTRGGGVSGTSRIVSPSVVASWRFRQNYADGRTTTLLVLWRGTPGWHSKGGPGGGSGGGGGSGSGRSGSYSYEYVTQGGLTFMMEFDDDHNVVKLLGQEIALADTNVVLVDFVDSPGGGTIVDRRWIDPAPSAQPAPPDPIAAVIKRTPYLYDYLQCGVSVPNPGMMNQLLTLICAQMRP
jgi:hypothetical protein